MSSLRLACGLGLLAVYVLPLFWPPATAPLLPPAFDASLSTRLFPGVPPWWVWGRLVAVAVGAWLVAGAAPAPGWVEPAVPPTAPERTRRLGAGVWLVAAVAGAHALWALRAPVMARPEQLAFVAGIVVPALLTALQRPPRLARRGFGPLLVVVALWAAAWVPVAWRSPWMASLADGFGALDMLISTRGTAMNLVVDVVRPAQSAMFLVFQGAGWIDWFDYTPTMPFVQCLHMCWLVVCALVVGRCADRLVGGGSGPVAAAALLFAPVVLMKSMFMGASFLGELLASVFVLCCLAVHDRGSVVALVLAGAVAGWMATFPSLLTLGYPGIIVVVALALRRPDVPRAAVAAAVATFAACVIPTLTAMLAFADLVAFYDSGLGEWATMEVAYFDQVDPERVRFQMVAGAPGRFDALLGSLLSPFATPRTALRSWGDVYIEPLAAALAAVGIAACARARSGRALALLGLFGASVVMGGVSSYDRASLLRLPALSVPMALLAAAGGRVLIASIGVTTSARHVALGAALAIAASGWSLMVLVNPRLLARSATTVALEALDAATTPDAAMVVPTGWSLSASGPFLAQVPRVPVAWMPVTAPADLAREDGAPVARLLLWSPAAEDRFDVSGHVCARWPVARIYVLRDAAGLSRVFGAVPSGEGWRPAIAPARWTADHCPVTLETEERLAATALTKARALLADGRPAEAIETMRSAARRSLVHVELFDELAGALLAHGDAAAGAREALWWARRAVTASGGCLPGPARRLHEAARRLGVDEPGLPPAPSVPACEQLPPGHPFRAAGGVGR